MSNSLHTLGIFLSGWMNKCSTMQIREGFHSLFKSTISAYGAELQKCNYFTYPRNTNENILEKKRFCMSFYLNAWYRLTFSTTEDSVKQHLWIQRRNTTLADVLTASGLLTISLLWCSSRGCHTTRRLSPTLYSATFVVFIIFRSSISPDHYIHDMVLNILTKDSQLSWMLWLRKWQSDVQWLFWLRMIILGEENDSD